MTQRNVSKATVPDRTVWLPTPACVIAAVRLAVMPGYFGKTSMFEKQAKNR